MKFLFLEPFYGGSHKEFADGLIETSSHEIRLLSLPARFWKWRMHGAALQFCRRLPGLADFDGILATNMMSITDFKALAGKYCPPVLVYFHESQITYPAAPGRVPDYHYPFTDITSALAAERVLFNSVSHMERFFAELPGFIKMMPDFRPSWAVDGIREKSGVCMPGCRFPTNAANPPDMPPGPPIIVWNHRWEHDKNPEAFFRALYVLADRGIEFRVAVMGQEFGEKPPEFKTAKKYLKDRIVRFGRVSSRDDYLDRLARGTVVVSTALQENFGISVIEAARYGCLPLVPRRLSYPEIMPAEFHNTLLYDSEAELVEKLADILINPGAYAQLRGKISRFMTRFAWKKRVADFDRELRALATGQAEPNCKKYRKKYY
ncbi:MAG: tRNA-queuosine alpha-mannosyltransferase domain-containing protein [Desulfosalsimonas sp.]